MIGGSWSQYEKMLDVMRGKFMNDEAYILFLHGELRGFHSVLLGLGND